MNSSARFYHCARCKRQVIICSVCDRGNIYCAQECAKLSRILSCRLSTQRYQLTFKGRRHHAARQARYRARQKKVTHQGSPVPSVHDVLPSCTNEPVTCLAKCHFCAKTCALAVRRGFLTRHARGRVRFYRDD